MYNPYLADVKSVQIGFKHTIFVLENKEIYGAGDNSKGVLGIGQGLNDTWEELKVIKEILVLMQLNLIWNFAEEIKKIKCGWNNTHVLTSNRIINYKIVGNYFQLAMEDLVSWAI